MKNEWFAIEITVKGEFVEPVSALLADAGSEGTVIEERILDTFVVPDDDLDGAEDYQLKSYFSKAHNPQKLISELQEAFQQTPALMNKGLNVQLGAPIRLEDWAESWKQNFSTMKIGKRLVIRPSWEDCQFQEGLAVVEIDPGMAFGTGTHGTTRLCLETLEEFFSGSNPPRNMLDVGTGSGILALGAAALGCATIVATDIDADACNVARENTRKNGFDQQITVTDQLLDALPGRYDVLVANILAEENVRLKQQFIDHLAPGGWLVLSGILKEKEDFVRHGFSSLPLDHISTRYAEEWVCLVFRRQD
ncbi:MAG: 50S ribosomal protein L11 methyltransferase [Deltaproteobacteria bacterium]|jgi:ribosomal protein L11 methyltransferase|nr:50S ribosomal protein L11 methyltransferase [Deltaproteobacteria bacterium]